MKDSKNPRNYWFKRRRYGFGWVPVSWQGWAAVMLFIAVLLVGALLLEDSPRNTFTTESAVFLAVVIVAAILLVVVSYLKGPKPKWRWGSKSTDDPDEDI